MKLQLNTNFGLLYYKGLFYVHLGNSIRFVNLKLHLGFFTKSYQALQNIIVIVWKEKLNNSNTLPNFQNISNIFKKMQPLFKNEISNSIVSGKYRPIVFIFILNPRAIYLITMNLSSSYVLGIPRPESDIFGVAFDSRPDSCWEIFSFVCTQYIFFVIKINTTI